MFKFILSLSVLTFVLFLNLTAVPNGEPVAAKDTTVENETTQEQANIISTLKDKLHSDLTEQDVIDQFGQPDQKMKDDMYGLPSFRYDFKHDEHYSLDADYQLVDMDALKNKQLEAIIYFDFDDEKNIRSAALYYVNDEQKIEEYRIFADGTEKKMEIE
ncbi:hypothetical protein [Cytobacillus kochii]|uniref:hypothetical protein n=1 Tax=Cytobacillus kochii TaxID=859143 RepID=UPI00247FA2CD|nr:hypothetical protein [Cytobacillus kochii]MDM5207967.1 hypothetical protein [Cytobacillus kochii]